MLALFLSSTYLICIRETCEIFQHVNSQCTKANTSVLIPSMVLTCPCLPGVLLLIAAVVLGKTGVTTGGGIPAAISKRG